MHMQINNKNNTLNEVNKGGSGNETLRLRSGSRIIIIIASLSLIAGFSSL
jgi:hypothetical protein